MCSGIRLRLAKPLVIRRDQLAQNNSKSVEGSAYHKNGNLQISIHVINGGNLDNS